MKSPKTTFVGILGAVSLIAAQLVNLIDNDPETVFNLNVVIEALTLVGIGWFARDNDVTSKQAGAE